MKMKCEAGYKPDSPLCAVCDEGYYRQIFDCFECKEVRWAEFSGFLVAVLALGVCRTCSTGVILRWSKYESRTTTKKR